jgi:hypothetical protein
LYHSSQTLGGNVRWGLGSNFMLNGTVRPDFSQVEADALQIAGDARFALFYAERRPFFVEGIENFQVDYGRDTDGDGSPDGAAYTADPATIPNWMQVMTVQLYILARNTDVSTGYTDNKTYQLGTVGTITPTGAATQFRRHVYTSVVRVKNPSERLETP